MMNVYVSSGFRELVPTQTVWQDRWLIRN